MAGFEGLSLGQLVKRLFKNASFYGIGMLLLKAGHLFLLPLYWLKMEPVDFGVIAVVQVVIGFLTPVLDMGIQSTVQRLYFDWNEDERPYFIGALWTLSFSISFVICLILDLLGSHFFSFFVKSVDFDPYLRIGVWTVFLTNASLMPLAILRSVEKIKVYTKTNFIIFVLQASLILYFLFTIENGALGFLLGQFLSYALVFPYFIYFMWRSSRLKFRKHHLSEPMNYCLPLIPSTFIEGVGSVLDRFFLEKFVPLSTLGIYNLARQFGLGYNLFLQIMKTSWLPMIYRIIGERSDGPRILSEMSCFYLAFLAIVGVAISTLSEEVILIIGAEKYFGIYPLIPYFVFAYMFYGIGHVFGRGLDLAKKTHFYFAMHAFSLIINFVLLSFLAPKYGVWGALASLIGSAIAREIIQVGLGHYYYPRPTNWKSILNILLVSGIFYFICSNVDFSHPMQNLIIKLLILGFFGIFLAYTTKRLRA